MKLPKIDLPLFEEIIPSTGKKVYYRQYSLKEEKILLLAKQSDDPNQNILAIKQVLTNCMPDTNIEELAVFDVLFMLLKIRGKSVNNIIEFVIVDPTTKEKINMTLDIGKCKVFYPEGHSNKITINNQYTLLMRYPNYDMYEIATKGETKDDPNTHYDMMLSCFDKLVSDTEVHDLTIVPRQELIDFAEGLGDHVTDQIAKFFDTMPKVRHELKYKTANGDSKVFVIEGFESFFE